MWHFLAGFAVAIVFAFLAGLVRLPWFGWNGASDGSMSFGIGAWRLYRTAPPNSGVDGIRAAVRIGNWLDAVH